MKFFKVGVVGKGYCNKNPNFITLVFFPCTSNGRREILKNTFGRSKKYKKLITTEGFCVWALTLTLETYVASPEVGQ
jgi:hypothetical protein